VCSVRAIDSLMVGVCSSSATLFAQRGDHGVPPGKLNEYTDQAAGPDGGGGNGTGGEGTTAVHELASSGQ
jgi:hypothetical protein